MEKQADQKNDIPNGEVIPLLNSKKTGQVERRCARITAPRKEIELEDELHDYDELGVRYHDDPEH